MIYWNCEAPESLSFVPAQYWTVFVWTTWNQIITNVQELTHDFYSSNHSILTRSQKSLALIKGESPWGSQLSWPDTYLSWYKSKVMLILIPLVCTGYVQVIIMGAELSRKYYPALYVWCLNPHCGCLMVSTKHSACMNFVAQVIWFLSQRLSMYD